ASSASAAHEFTREHRREKPSLAESGGQFSQFLALFQPCRDLAYLTDVARLEWAINEALHAESPAVIARHDLSAISPAEAPRVAFSVHPSLRLLESLWPIERIWRANQGASDPDFGIDLDSGGVRLQVHRCGDRVTIKSLTECEFAFLGALADGKPLGDAAEAALRIDLLFDLTVTLGPLLEEGGVVGFHLEG